LTLPDTEIDLILLSKMMTQELAVPQILAVLQFTRRTAQIFLKFLSDGNVQRRWSSGTILLLETGKTSLLEPLYPVLNGAPAVTEEICDIRAAISTRHHQHSMEAVIVTGFFGPFDLLLDGNPHDVRIFDLKSLHIFLRFHII
jgi:hypothetical protein